MARCRWSLFLIGVVSAAAVEATAPRDAWAQLRTKLVASGLAQCVAIIQDPADASVQFIVQRTGQIKVLHGGILERDDFLDLTTQTTTERERGLLGLAFPPDASTSRRFFVEFTDTDGNVVVARFKRMADNPLRADATSRFDLVWPDGRGFIGQPTPSHIGGTLRFGPDGYLYLGKGDGGRDNDPTNQAQNPDVLHGKILRIDVSVPDDDVRGYRIPPDNPFLDGVPIRALSEIYALGFRNPWKFSFDDPLRGGTGGLWIGDVGQSAREEVDFIPAGKGGRNYGWRIAEGTLPGEAPRVPPAFEPLENPVYDYPHTMGHSVTGGYVYRGRRLPRQYVADTSSRISSSAESCPSGSPTTRRARRRSST